MDKHKRLDILLDKVSNTNDIFSVTEKAKAKIDDKWHEKIKDFNIVRSLDDLETGMYIKCITLDNNSCFFGVLTTIDINRNKIIIKNINNGTFMKLNCTKIYIYYKEIEDNFTKELKKYTKDFKDDEIIKDINLIKEKPIKKKIDIDKLIEEKSKINEYDIKNKNLIDKIVNKLKNKK